MNRERLEQIALDPNSATRSFHHEPAGPLTMRLLTAGDAEAFGHYLEELGPETRRRFGPHPHTMAAAEALCGEIDHAKALRLLVEADAPSADGIVGYFIVYPRVNPAESKRFEGHGQPLDSETDCTFAPSLADACQGKGLGSAATVLILELARELGFERMVLSGGTQADNDRAIRYYRKVGFQTAGSFETNAEQYGPMSNYDMILML